MKNVPDFVKNTTWQKILNHTNNGGETSPYLLVDEEMIRDKVALVGKHIRNAHVFYAIKANPDRQLVELVNSLGIGFEIASEGELQIVKSVGIEPERIITSNTVKTVGFIEQLFAYGVRYFAFDSADEVRKLSQFAPGAHVYVRLSVPNEGSEWPLSKKFGVEIDDASELLMMAKHSGLDPVGITFHVGSQCTNIYNWDSAIHKAWRLWNIAESKGIHLKMLNMGGGYPISYTKRVDDIATIEQRVDDLLHDKFPEETQIFIEPGRSIVGDAGFFVSTVIGKAKRDDENWLYIDVGVFGGLMESIGGIKYTYFVKSENEEKTWVLAGPTCDSFDVVARNVKLPEPDIGEHFIILASGAYTTSYASAFNGFSVPKTIII